MQVKIFEFTCKNVEFMERTINEWMANRGGIQFIKQSMSGTDRYPQEIIISIWYE